MIDINTATISQLESAPGMTADRAAAIIAGRPWQSVTAMVTKLGYFAPGTLAALTCSPVAAVTPPPATPSKPALTPSAPVVVVPPVVPTPPIIIVGASDLAPLIASMTGPKVLPPNGHYKLGSLANLKYSLDGSGSLLDIPQGTTNFKAVAPGVTLANWIAYKGGLFFEAAADNCQLVGCKLGVGQAPGSFMGAFKTVPGGTNAKFRGNHVGVTTSVSAYCDQNGVQVGGPNDVDKNILDGSLNEYALRLEVGGADGKTIPVGALVQKNTVSNGTRKDAIGVRAFLLTNVLDNIISGDVRYGQVPGAGEPAPTVGQYCTGNLLRNHFASNGMLISLCEAYQGVKLLVGSNIFTNPIAPAVTADSYSEITTQDNTVQVYAGSHPWEFWAASAKGRRIDLGGDKTIIVPAA